MPRYLGSRGPLRVGSDRNETISFCISGSFLFSHWRVAPGFLIGPFRMVAGSMSAVSKIAVAFCPLGTICDRLRTDRHAQAPQPVASPREFEAQYRKPERYDNESRTRRNDHDDTCQQHGPTDDQHGYPPRGPAGNVEGRLHPRYSRSKGPNVDWITTALRHRRIFLRDIVAYAP